MGGTLATYIDKFYFTENSLKVRENQLTKKGERGPLGPPLNPKKDGKPSILKGAGTTMVNTFRPN